MNSKRYILREEDIGQLATSIAIQERDMAFTKDINSSFYIAVLDDDIQIPSELKILEMAEENKTPITPEIPRDLPATQEKPPTGKVMNIDLMVRLKVMANINKEHLEKLLYEELNKALAKTMKRLQNEDDGS